MSVPRRVALLSSRFGAPLHRASLVRSTRSHKAAFWKIFRTACPLLGQIGHAEAFVRRDVPSPDMSMRSGVSRDQVLRRTRRRAILLSHERTKLWKVSADGVSLASRRRSAETMLRTFHPRT